MLFLANKIKKIPIFTLALEWKNVTFVDFHNNFAFYYRCQGLCLKFTEEYEFFSETSFHF